MPTAFRPRGFSPPRRFTPRSGCGSIAPRYRSWGSLRFRIRTRPPPARDGVGWFLSRNALHTLQRVSLMNSRAVSPQPLPTWGSHHLTTRVGPASRYDTTRAPRLKTQGGSNEEEDRNPHPPSRSSGRTAEVPGGLHDHKGRFARSGSERSPFPGELDHEPPTRLYSIHESVP